MLESLALAYATSLGLTAARVAGFVVVSPVPGEQAPAQTRVGLVILLSAVVAFMIAEPAAAPPSIGSLVVHACFELGLGLLIGLVFRFILAGADVLGGALSQASGLGAASLFNPALGAHDTPLGQVMSLFAMLLALGVGAHRVALSYLLESFRALPVGTMAPLPAAAPQIAELASAAIAVGVRLAMPVIAVSMAIQLVLALVARAAPSLQIFSVGFTFLILSGFVTVSLSLRAIAVGLVDHLGSLGGELERLLLSLAST